MMRALPLIALLLLPACVTGTSEAPPAGGAAEAPQVRVGGSFRAYYGHAMQ